MSYAAVTRAEMLDLPGACVRVGERVVERVEQWVCRLAALSDVMMEEW